MALLYLAVAFLGGIAFGRTAWDAGLVPCDFPKWLWIAFLAALPFTPLLNRLQPVPQVPTTMRWPASAGFEPPRRSLSIGLLAAAVLCLAAGFTRYAPHPMNPCLDAGDLAYWNAPYAARYDDAQPVAILDGYISSYPSVRDTSQRLDVTVHRLTVDGTTHAVEGIMRLNANLDQRFVYGQPIVASGVLTAPYPGEEGAYRDYLARRGIRSQLHRPQILATGGEPQGNRLLRSLYHFRARGEHAINRLLPAPYASLAGGMLLGIETGIPAELMDDFRETGTSHVIVISGSNVALIAGVLAGFFARLLGKRRAWVPVVAGIAVYALLVGGDSAVLRAALMGGLAVVAVGLNRHGTAIIALAAACWLLTLLNPLALWDAGFQLSAMATAGLILLTPPIARAAAWLWPGWLGGPLSSPYINAPAESGTQPVPQLVRGLVEDSLVVSLAAGIAVLPLLAHTFGRVSAIGILANLLIVPVQPLITVWGSAGAFAGALGAMLPAQLLLWIAWPGLFWTVQVVERTAELPFASVETAGYGMGAMIATYLLIAALLWRRQVTGWVASRLPNRRYDAQAALKSPAVMLAATLLTVLVWWGYLSMPDGRLHVYFLDVGQGDAILIESPTGRQVLIDGGSSPQALLSELGAVMPFWDRSLDMVVLTHADGDHMDAQTQALSRFDIRRAITTQKTLDSVEAAAWTQQLASADIEIAALHAGGWIDLGDGVALWALSPQSHARPSLANDNENSLVLKLVYAEFSALLTADAGLATEQEWLATGAPIQATVLKVGHHGSRTSTGSAFARAVSPQVAIIQVGADNRYGHPHPEVLASLAECPVLRNDVHGRVHIASDGRQLWVETETGELAALPALNAGVKD